MNLRFAQPGLFQKMCSAGVRAYCSKEKENAKGRARHSVRAAKLTKNKQSAKETARTEWRALPEPVWTTGPQLSTPSQNWSSFSWNNTLNVVIEP